jgi:hypothetical protein
MSCLERDIAPHNNLLRRSIRALGFGFKLANEDLVNAAGHRKGATAEEFGVSGICRRSLCEPDVLPLCRIMSESDCSTSRATGEVLSIAEACNAPE